MKPNVSIRVRYKHIIFTFYTKYIGGDIYMASSVIII